MSQLRGADKAPRSPFPLLPLRTGVLFPGTTIALPIGRDRSMALVQSLAVGAVIAVVTQRDKAIDNPALEDLHSIGTFARVQDIRRVNDRTFRIVLEGLGRFELDGLVRSDPFWLASGAVAPESGADDPEAKLIARALHDHVRELVTKAGGRANTVSSPEDNPGLVADIVAAGLNLDTEKEVQVLGTLDVPARLRLVSDFLAEIKAMSDVKSKIEADVRKELGKHQREVLLREQLRAIRKELGDDGGEGDPSDLRARLDKADLPPEVRTAAERELRRLDTMGAQAPEHHVIRTYLEWILDLPWNARAEAKDDIDAVAAKLEADHFGLADVKRRILEHMAVLKVAGNPRGSILCLAGPPGVGKTSLGQSIADATGRPLVRIALGGVRDEAELRGHRRTYVGALPGRVVNALRKAKVKNPVILLDEIDKLGQSWNGSPEAALLELLDPEQNRSFTDHYLELPFDLSEALFVCTANNLDALSAPLRDRLEIIELSGYTLDEKVHIAREHLVPKQLREHAIESASLTLTEAAVQAIVRDYTREAGVRQLNREIGKLCRAFTLEIARSPDSKAPHVRIDEADLGKYLGKVRFFSEVAERTAVAGVATGLAWTPVGGDILFIETSRMPGKGKLEITGQLGDVMKESARAALSYVRSNSAALGVSPDFLESQDLHLHVPAGAVPKDGPSAGVTIFTALTSLLTGRKVRSDTAMTGECTLRGRVLPVGGIKAKVLAAHRAGLTRVILPARNARDIDDVPADTRAALTFILAEDMSQVIEAALEPASEVNEPTGAAPVLPAQAQPDVPVRSAA